MYLHTCTVYIWKDTQLIALMAPEEGNGDGGGGEGNGAGGRDSEASFPPNILWYDLKFFPTFMFKLFKKITI